MRTLNGCRICLIACLVLSLAGCQRDDKASSSLATKPTKQRDDKSVPITTVYSGGGVTIRRVLDDENGNAFLYMPGGAIEIRGDLFHIAWLAAHEMLRNEATFPKGGYVVCVETPDKEMDKEELKRRAWGIIVPAYKKAFHVSIHHVSRTEDVFVLQIRDSGLRNVEKAKKSDSWGSGTSRRGYEFRRYSFAELSDFLANEFDDVVLDETKDEGVHTFEVPVNISDIHNPAVWIVGLKDVGLELRRL